MNINTDNSPAASVSSELIKKSTPGFPGRRLGPLSRGPILGRGKGGGVGGKGRTGMRTGTR